jgi:hypothetical protein
VSNDPPPLDELAGECAGIFAGAGLDGGGSTAGEDGAGAETGAGALADDSDCAVVLCRDSALNERAGADALRALVVGIARGFGCTRSRRAAAVAIAIGIAPSVGGLPASAVGISALPDAACRVEGVSPWEEPPVETVRPIAKKHANTTIIDTTSATQWPSIVASGPPMCTPKRPKKRS